MGDNAWSYPGSRWWKFDFHTHTPASRCAKWPTTEDAAGLTHRAWLLKFMQAGIDCVAVTDHNTSDWIAPLQAAYKALQEEQPDGYRTLHIFPGVEISVHGGVHVLAIFDTNKGASEIDKLLGKVDYQGTPGDSDGVTSKSLTEVLEAVESLGGLAIPAHVDQEKGLFRLQDSNTLKQVIDCGHILAIEVVERSVPKPEIYQQSKCRWAEVLGSDCHTFRGVHPPGTRFTWVKMADPSLAGLRLALLDGANFSVRRSDDPVLFSPLDLPAHRIQAIEISEARYMGRGKPQVLEFSPWFNGLVGGRGTGKSTIVHALRLVYRRQAELENLPEQSDARQTFERFAREPRNRNDESGALDYESSRKTSIQVTLFRDGARNLLRWRQDDTGPKVEDCVDGKWVTAASQSIQPDRFPLSIFSQGEIAALAGERQTALLALVDAAADTRSLLEAKSRAGSSFLALRAKLRELDSRLSGLAELQAKLGDVQRKLDSFEGKQHAEILRAYQLRARQNREVDRQLEAASQMVAQLRESAGKLTTEDVPQGLFDPSVELDREALDVVMRVHAAVEATSAAVNELATRLEDGVQQARNAMAATAWFVSSIESRTRYEELIQQLKDQGVADPSEYGKLVQDRQRLEAEIAQLESLQQERSRVEADSDNELRNVRKLRRDLTDRRSEFLSKVLHGNSYVRIEVLPYGRSHEVIEKELREALTVTDDRFAEDILSRTGEKPSGGLVYDLLKALPDDFEEARRRMERGLQFIGCRFEAAASGNATFGGRFNNFLQREAAKRPEFIDRLLLWSPEDALRVEHSPRGDGRDFKSIEQASAGQRAAAMLAFLLAYGDEPLVLDQPEDDLDNHLIYELVVQQIRNMKMRRQLIVVTHNPNIVVNGDAEMVHAFDFTQGQCRVVEKGALQEQSIRDEVCRVMEGGREAFERRFRRLGTE